MSNRLELEPQGLKPNFFALCGTAEAVPFPISFHAATPAHVARSAHSTSLRAGSRLYPGQAQRGGKPARLQKV
jgi:hypothetical protein